jgi:hypothetical protein
MLQHKLNNQAIALYRYDDALVDSRVSRLNTIYHAYIINNMNYSAIIYTILLTSLTASSDAQRNSLKESLFTVTTGLTLSAVTPSNDDNTVVIILYRQLFEHTYHYYDY